MPFLPVWVLTHSKSEASNPPMVGCDDVAKTAGSRGCGDPRNRYVASFALGETTSALSEGAAIVAEPQDA